MRKGALAAAALACALAAPSPAPAQTQDARWLTFFSVRPMFGGALVLPEQSAVGGEFAADFSVGVRFFRQRRDGRAWLLAPEVGFTPLKRGDDVTVFWQFGLQVGYGTLPLHLAWTPRFVAGAVGSRDAVGVRNGAMLTLGAGLLCVELSHQYLWADGEDEHGLRLTAGVDVGMLVHRLMSSITGLYRW